MTLLPKSRVFLYNQIEHTFGKGVIIMNYLEDNIKHLYSTLKVEKPEHLNIEDIAHKLHIRLFWWDDSSLALIHNEQPCIFLQRSILNTEWEDFCHELAHILYHAGDQMKLPTEFIQYQEYKANNFALHAAIPTFMLLNMNLPNDYYQAVALLQKTFKVSLTFACKRLSHFLDNYVHNGSQNTYMADKRLPTTTDYWC